MRTPAPHPEHAARPRVALALAVLALVALVGLAGCGELAPFEPDWDEDLDSFVVTVHTSQGLRQEVRISEIQPFPGDTIVIESVVTNRSSSPQTVELRVCGLDLQGDLALAFTPNCRGYSEWITLRPGEVRLQWQEAVVRSRPGSYTIRVRHLLDPETWVRLRVDVARD
jgi:hypothetical protein